MSDEEKITGWIESSVYGFLVSVVGSGGQHNEGGTYAMSLPSSITLFIVTHRCQ